MVFDRFRNILHEHDLDKRVAYMIEVLFQIRKEKFKQHPAIREELDLVEEEDQITHQTDLEDDLDAQDSLNIFKFDSQWEEHETAYGKIKAEILGEVSGSESEDDESEDVSDDEEAEKEREMEIKDQTNTDLVNLRRTIYLTIMSSPDFEQCVHKLMKVNLPPGQEPELPSMIIECCSQERTYSKFFGLVGERFAKLNRYWMEQFEMQFSKYYSTVHRLESNKLRNVARFFGHLLSSDAIGWHCMSIIHLNEDETTSSSRIFIKILVQDLSESLGLPKLPARFLDEALRPSFEGIFPRENPRNIRFSINFFTSIGMGAITEEMRERLKNMPKPANPTIPAAQAIGASDSVSVSSYSSYTGSSGSFSRSPSPSRSRPRAQGRGRARDRSFSRSTSRTPPRRIPQRRSYTASMSRSPSSPRRRRRSPSYSSRSLSRSPPPRGRPPPARNGRSRSPRRSRSPLPPSRRRGTSQEGRGALRSPSPRRPNRGAPQRRPSYTPSSSRSPPPRTKPPQERNHSRSNLPSPHHREKRINERHRYSASLSPPPAERRRNTSSPESREVRRAPEYASTRRDQTGGATAKGAREGRMRAEDYL